MQLMMFDGCMDNDHLSLFGKMSPACSRLETTPSDTFLVRFAGMKGHYSRQGINGQTQVWCLVSDGQSLGASSMPNISVSPNDARECLLSQVLETSIQQKYFLSAKACAGILRRADKRGKTLPLRLKMALENIVRGRGNGYAHDQNGAKIRKDAFTPSLTCNHEPPIIIHGRQDPLPSAVAHPLAKQSNGMDNVICIKGNAINRAPQHGGNCLGVADNEISYTLTVSDIHAVQYADVVRRLMPVECERLQGMPDNHTRIPWRGKDAANCPDGPRYEAIGNSMAVPVMRWVGERIAIQSNLAASSLAVGL